MVGQGCRAGMRGRAGLGIGQEHLLFTAGTTTGPDDGAFHSRGGRAPWSLVVAGRLGAASEPLCSCVGTGLAS